MKKWVGDSIKLAKWYSMMKGKRLIIFDTIRMKVGDSEEKEKKEREKVIIIIIIIGGSGFNLHFFSPQSPFQWQIWNHIIYIPAIVSHFPIFSHRVIIITWSVYLSYHRQRRRRQAGNAIFQSAWNHISLSSIWFCVATHIFSGENTTEWLTDWAIELKWKYCRKNSTQFCCCWWRSGKCKYGNQLVCNWCVPVREFASSHLFFSYVCAYSKEPHNEANDKTCKLFFNKQLQLSAKDAKRISCTMYCTACCVHIWNYYYLWLHSHYSRAHSGSGTMSICWIGWLSAMLKTQFALHR